MIDVTFYLNKTIEFIERVGGVRELLYGDSWEEYDSEDYDVAAGASKVVLIFKNSDYVVKIPFFGEGYWSEDEDGNEEESYDEFTCARISDDEYGWDYCESERYYYNKALEANMEEFFIETIFIGQYENHPIYVQEKVEVFGYHSKTKSSESSRKIFLEKFNRSQIQNEDFGGLLIDYYGEERVKQLDIFLSEVGISDLHSSNVGIRANRPVLFDYSGYNS